MTKRFQQRGHAAVEVALMLPWMIFSFVATLDFGIYAYALISTQNAARTAAMYASQSLAVAQGGSVTTQACYYALEELRDAPGVGAGVTTCSGSPVSVSVSARTPGASGINTVKVSVTYQTMAVIAMPGLMPGSLSISKTVEMPIR